MLPEVVWLLRKDGVGDEDEDVVVLVLVDVVELVEVDDGVLDVVEAASEGAATPLEFFAASPPPTPPPIAAASTIAATITRIHSVLRGSPQILFPPFLPVCAPSTSPDIPSGVTEDCSSPPIMAILFVSTSFGITVCGASPSRYLRLYSASRRDNAWGLESGTTSGNPSS